MLLLAALLVFTAADVLHARTFVVAPNGRDDNPGTKEQPLATLAAARAALAAGKADLEKAVLNLERATIRAPFKGRISDRNVDAGQFVPAGMSLGSMFSTDVAEIVVPMPDEDLYWFSVPGFTPGSEEGCAHDGQTRRPVQSCRCPLRR